MSQAGACLEASSPIGIPNDLVLVIGYDELKQACHVVWRSDTRLCIEFAPPGAPGARQAAKIPPPPAASARNLAWPTTY